MLEITLLVLGIFQDLMEGFVLVVKHFRQPCQAIRRFGYLCFVHLGRGFNFFCLVLGVGNSLTLGLDLFRQRIIFAVVSDLKLLLLVSRNQKLGILDVYFRLLVGFLVLLLLPLEILEADLQPNLLIFKIPDFVWKISTQFLDLIDPAIYKLKPNESLELISDATVWHSWRKFDVSHDR